MTTLLCIAGAGLASATITPGFQRSSVVRLMTSSLRGNAPAVPAAAPVPSRSPVVSPPVISPPVISPAPAAATVAGPSPADQAAAAGKVTQAARAILPGADVGFEVFDRDTGTMLASQDADRQFASMSVVKLLIALDVLAGDNGALPDNGTQQELHQMLAASDDDIADDLWSADGGPAIVTRMASTLELTGTQPPSDPGEWGDTLITAQDMVKVYQYITNQLPQPQRDLILGALSDAPKIAADGFNQYFGIPDGLPGASWAVKQGWGTSGSEAVMNSTGLVGPDWRYVVVVLVSAPVNSYSTVPAAVTAGAAAVSSLVSPGTS
ncbi:MAG TPA: hypothetical protein VFO16_19350 [Pseudonocardiaceae bacterium]|nr:hypothetical protein [Pseudonocardiaceae bacterium]